jgi:hypothetical protein
MSALRHLHAVAIENASVLAFAAGLEIADGQIAAVHVAGANAGRNPAVRDDAPLEYDGAADVVDDRDLLVVRAVVDDLDVDVAVVRNRVVQERAEEEQNRY